MSKVYANTFQTFNIYVDRAMEHLTDAELRVLLYATRHIMGWQDKITSRTACMSLPMFEKGFTVTHDDGTTSQYGGCGLSRPVISKALNSLETLGFLERAGFEQDKGQRWRLAEQPDWEALEARSATRNAANRKRTEKATASRKAGRSNVARTYPEGVVTSDDISTEERQNGVVTSDDTMVVTSDVPKQTQDQTHQNKDSAPDGADVPPLTILTKSGKPKTIDQLWYDAVLDVFRITQGRNRDMGKMIRGMATKKGYKEYNLETPLTEPVQLTEWKHWYLAVKNRGKRDVILPLSPEKVQSSIGEWQALAHQSRSASPAAVEQERIRKLRMQAEREERERINQLAREQSA